jgi:hypothetical protein
MYASTRAFQKRLICRLFVFWYSFLNIEYLYCTLYISSWNWNTNTHISKVHKVLWAFSSFHCLKNFVKIWISDSFYHSFSGVSNFSIFLAPSYFFPFSKNEFRVNIFRFACLTLVLWMYLNSTTIFNQSLTLYSLFYSVLRNLLVVLGVTFIFYF